MELRELSELADEYAEKRDQRLAKQKEVDALAAEESDLKQQLIQIMREQKVSTVGGKNAVVTYRTKNKPIASDWAEVYTYIREHDAFDLLQKRLNESAVKLRWEDQIVIPGLATFVVEEISISKPKV